jgi:cyanate permease
LLAGLPFFMVTALALFISFLTRHFTQYASIFYPHIIR